MTRPATYDAIVVGAGFSGIYMLYRLRAMGLSARVLEAGTGPGGTWFWNRYPGLRCDVESMTYSYSFSDELQREWTWTERYATQAEIERYINWVVDRLDLRRDIQFETRVTSAVFDEASERWSIGTERGDQIEARYCVMATGCLSVPNMPRIKGLERFKGRWVHTADWPREEIDFKGKRVGVIGTGSSGVQAIPVIAEEAAHLTVFQRTANHSIPAWNHPLTEEAVRRWKEGYKPLRAKALVSPVGDVFDPPTQGVFEVSADERWRRLEKHWQLGSFGFLSAFNDMLTNKASSDTVGAFVDAKIRAVVKDPAVADKLCPRNLPIGTKRLCVDTNYYETFNRDNVTLIDIKANPIDEITPSGLRAGGVDHPLDIIVFAIGYDAMTGALLRINPRGRDGVALKERWQHGPRTYLGLMVAGFPNLFTVTGPGSPSVISNMLVSIEQHIDWIADCIAHLERNGRALIEATPEAEERWTRHVTEVAEGTLFLQAETWYVGANIPGKPRVIYPYLGGVGAYRVICDGVAAKDYEGFRVSRGKTPTATAARRAS